MKRILPLLLTFTFVTAIICNAQDNKSLLWRISGKHMSKPSYLFGTIHLICPKDYLWTPAMDRSFKKSDEVCFELDLDNPQVIMQVATAMMDNSGKTLKDYFTEEQYKKVEQYLKDSMSLDINVLSQMKPIALLTMMTEKTVSCTNPISYEDKLAANAKAQKKEIEGLEDVQEQVDLLDNIPTDTVVKEVLDALHNNGDDRADYQKMVDFYKKQDLESLYTLIKKSNDLGDDMGAFLDERNKRWIERMVDKMDQKSVFFAVGAGHLWGENGVINLLRQEGYLVEPVK